MLQKNKTINRNNRKGRLAAVLALAVLLGAAPAVKTEAVDLSGCTITVNSPKVSDANVVLDFYQLASGVEQTGYDAYDFAWNSGFSAQETLWNNSIDAVEEGKTVSAEAVNALAQSAAAVVLETVPVYMSGDAAGTPTVNPLTSGIALDSPAEVPAGLYLIIAHGSDLTDYKGEADDGTLYSIATGKTKLYEFAPMLVSVPSRADAATIGNVTILGLEYETTLSMTSDTGAWNNAVTIQAKAGAMELFGSIEITKKLDAYETLSNRTDTATFVFSIEAVDAAGNSVYSNVTSLVFDGAGSKSVVVDRIPAGSTVTVKEIYKGGNYESVGSADSVTLEKIPADTGDEEKDADNRKTASFENTYDDTFNGGGSVRNHFDSEDDGGKWGTDISKSNKNYSDGRQEKLITPKEEGGEAK